jgi:hypothetical protein
LEGRYAAAKDLPNLSGRQFIAGFVQNVDFAEGGPADGSGPIEPFLRRSCTKADALAAAVIFVDGGSKPSEHLSLDFGRTGGARVDSEFHAADGIFSSLFLGQTQHSHEHRRNELAMRDAVYLDEPQGF